MGLKILRYYDQSKRKRRALVLTFFHKLANRKYTQKEIFGIFDRWLRRQLFIRKLFRWDENNEHIGLGVFIIRYNAVELGLINKIRTLITKYGFKIIVEKKLEPDDINNLINVTPHYKWKSSTTNKRGYPEVCIVVYDPKPIYIYSKRYTHWLHFYPYLDNLRLLFKHSIRLSILRNLPIQHHSNFIHATDNLKEAWIYIKARVPEKELTINNAITQIRSVTNRSIKE